MRLIAMTLAAALTACAAAQATEIKEHPLRPGGRPPAGPFDLVVSFGSYAAGIDRAAYEAATAHVRGSGVPASAVSWAWGREGERSLGLTFRSDAERDTFACELKAITDRAREGRDAASSSPAPSYELSGAQMKSCK